MNPCALNPSLGHVLLITPSTFSYEFAISDSLRSLGYDVHWWDDRIINSTWYKIALRLLPNLTKRLSEATFLDKLSEVSRFPISHILIVKGEGLSLRVLLAIRDRFPGASMGLYLWDSIKNSRSGSPPCNLFDLISTFDPVDAKSFGWRYRPLFKRDVQVFLEGDFNMEFDWCFIGTIHSDRHRVIHRLRSNCGVNQKSFVFGYFQSSLILILRYLTDWTLWFAPSGSLSTESMPINEVARKVACSNAVLDVEHPSQCGLTMRTIETLLSGKKLVTTNFNIFNSNLFHPSRVHVIDRANPEIPNDFLKTPFEPISNRLKKYYSCQYWVVELLMLQDRARFKRLGSTIK